MTVIAAQRDYTTPVPILKQINRHNEDGSYSYGYEAADGSFKIETKYPTGEVQGKYGYVDDSGKLREIEYGASKRGFEPAGRWTGHDDKYVILTIFLLTISFRFFRYRHQRSTTNSDQHQLPTSGTERRRRWSVP